MVTEEMDGMLIMDGYDDCILGICYRIGQENIVAYDYDSVIAKLMSEGMDELEAIEYFEYNQLGAWVGDTTPCFIKQLNNENNE